MNTIKTWAMVVVCMSAAACDSGSDSTDTADQVADDSSTDSQTSINLPENAMSPVRRIDRDRRGRGDDRDRESVRTIDGSLNNRQEPTMNEVDTVLRRVAPVGYADLVSTLAGDNRPNVRTISNAVNAQTVSVPNRVQASDFLWQWGQFLDHDIDLTDGVSPVELANIAIPAGDAWFDPDGSGDAILNFNRSIYDVSTGTSVGNPREQINEITGWIDASNVYGSTLERATALRTNDGSGKLKTSAGNLLPFNVDGLANAGGDSDLLFLAGDVRANEQVGLTAMHTLFVREHNRLAAEIARKNRGMSGDEIYETARRIVGAQMQVITYEEFLPVLLGQGALAQYQGYDESVDSRITNEFSTAAYRLGHSMLSSHILRLDSRGRESAAGHLPLRLAFFAPGRLADEGGLEPLLRGLAAQLCQEIDVLIVDDVRNFLFGEPLAGGFDLASLNIQRGRDHGLADYNSVRTAFGLLPNAAFGDVTSSLELQDKLSSVYGSVDDMDLWVGGLAEDPLPNSMLGELFHTIVKNQFEALRDGDRYWYERTLSNDELRQVENVRLADIIRRNTSIRDEIQDNVFIVN